MKKLYFRSKKYLDEKIKMIESVVNISDGYDTSICSFYIKNYNAQDVASYLGKNKIIVRGGVSCVKLQHHVTGKSDGFVRVSLHIYNTKEEIDKFISVLRVIDKKIYEI